MKLSIESTNKFYAAAINAAVNFKPSSITNLVNRVSKDLQEYFIVGRSGSHIWISEKNGNRVAIITEIDALPFKTPTRIPKRIATPDGVFNAEYDKHTQTYFVPKTFETWEHYAIVEIKKYRGQYASFQIVASYYTEDGDEPTGNREYWEMKDLKKAKKWVAENENYNTLWFEWSYYVRFDGEFCDFGGSMDIIPPPYNV